MVENNAFQKKRRKYSAQKSIIEGILNYFHAILFLTMTLSFVYAHTNSVWADTCPCPGSKTGKCPADTEDEVEDWRTFSKTDTAGNILQTWCCDKGGPGVDFFLRIFKPAGGDWKVIGKCPFEGGLNSSCYKVNNQTPFKWALTDHFHECNSDDDDDNDGHEDHWHWIYYPETNIFKTFHFEDSIKRCENAGPPPTDHHDLCCTKKGRDTVCADDPENYGVASTHEGESLCSDTTGGFMLLPIDNSDPDEEVQK